MASERFYRQPCHHGLFMFVYLIQCLWGEHILLDKSGGFCFPTLDEDYNKTVPSALSRFISEW